MARWLVTGSGGMLGQDLISVLRARGEEVIGLTRADLDITDEAVVRETVAEHRPATVVNCAAWTAVDDAETHEAQALAVNGRGAANLAAACRATGAALMHVSTDYVFDGDATKPWAEDDLPAPRSAYGAHQARRRAGGAGPAGGHRLRGADGLALRRARTQLRPHDDPAGGEPAHSRRRHPPARSAHLDAGRGGPLVALAHAGARPGIYHATSSGETNWFGLAQEVFRLIGADPDRIRPTTSSQFRRPALRPSCSVLGHGAWTDAGLPPIQDWRDALRQAMSSLTARG